MNQDFPEDELLVQEYGALGVIILNRPEALNALSLDMIRAMSSALRRWEQKPAIRGVFIAGADGGRAFCAGGDVKTVYYAGLDARQGKVDFRVPALFFAEEYSLNRQIFHYSKPVIAFMNGITMGGGYGIAGNARYRIATDKTLFAMPEVGIGFFPDVGSLYHLSRCSGHFGRYLALSGERIGPGDMVRAGLAACYIEAGSREKLVKALEKAVRMHKVELAIDEALTSFALPPPEGESLPRNAERIESVFSHADIDGILEALQREGSLWAIDLFDLLCSRAPASVKVTAAHFNKALEQSFDEIIADDFVLAQHFLRRNDFYEGIRALLVDKDKTPSWSQGRFEDVTQDEIESYFEPTGHVLEDIRIFISGEGAE
ncbi:MAG: enoyl-CoA hydratase/isomerase family protein [Alphaproteobacteria bacterium]|nr:enoyl-CoA hydratase/isomerase family protein [Alphaproteobacteria bacterium]